MRRKAKKDNLNAWVDPKITTTTSIFSCEGNLDRDLIEVGPLSD